jgi:hypothetical protein
MAKLNIYEVGWYLDEAMCPCDLHFLKYLEHEKATRQTIFHFGTGEHHVVGIRCHEAGSGHAVLGITASTQEHDAYEATRFCSATSTSSTNACCPRSISRRCFTSVNSGPRKTTPTAH